MKLSRKLLLLTAVSLSGFGIAVSSAAVSGSDILARVSDKDVRIDDIRTSLETLNPREQAALAANPALLNQAVRSLLARRIVLNEALAQKWDQNPAFTAQFEKMRENALIESYLLSVAQPPADFPSEADLQAVYEANKSALTSPRQVRLAQIYIADPESADAATRKQARTRLDDVKQKLAKKGADFSAIARIESEQKETAANGGELGWLADSQIRPEVRTAIANLAAGKISEPLRLDDGWHILKVLEVREARPFTLDEVRAQLAQRLRAEQAQANRQAYLSRLMEKNPMVINEFALSQVLEPAAAAAAPSKSK